jgi:hypothetical protein
MEPTKQTAQSPEDKAYLRKQMIKLFLFLGISVGVALWMMIAEIWPANKLIDLQAAWFNGEYYPKLTFGVIWIMVLLVFVLIFSLLDGLWRKIKGKK